MDIITVLDKIEDHLANCKHELHAGNGFLAESHLVRLREYLNAQPELEAGRSCQERRS